LNSKWKVIWTNEVQKYYKKFSQKERFQKIIFRLKQDPHKDVNIKKLLGKLEDLPER